MIKLTVVHAAILVGRVDPNTGETIDSTADRSE